MSYVSNVLGGGSSVGDQMSFMDVGTFYPAPSGETWLRNGTWVSPASAPTAATIPYLCATGQATGALPAALASSAFDIATDNAGRWVIAYGHLTNVMVSTDNGATWATVAHNAGGAVTSVCYTSLGGGLFVSAGNISSVFYTSSVAAASVGSAWTARTGSAITGGTADTARVRSSSAEVVMVCAAGTTGNASRSTNGTTWTAANLAEGLSVTNANNSLLSLGGGVWVTQQANVTGNRTTDGGVTWSANTLPVGFYNCAFGGGLMLASDNNSNIWSSATGATGSFTNIGKVLGSYTLFPINGGMSLQHNGTYFIASVRNNLTSAGALGFYATSSDGTSWAVKTALGKTWAETSSSNTAIYVDGDGDYVMCPSYFSHSSGSTIVRGNLTTTTGVGINRSSSSGGGVFPPTVQYVRIA